MLTISLTGAFLLVLLLWAGFMGKYWDRNVPGGDEGGWRRSFASATYTLWFPLGKDLWPLGLMAVMFLFGPYLLQAVFKDVNQKRLAAAIGHITIPGKLATVKVFDRQSASVFDWEDYQKILRRGKVEMAEEIGGGIILVTARDRGEPWKAVSHGKIRLGDEVYIRTGYVRQGRENNNEPLYWIITKEEVQALLRKGFKLE